MNPWRPGWRNTGRDAEHDNGQEPDYRFTLANEPTFLAWIRTALGLLAGRVLMAQFANRLAPPFLLEALAVGLALSASAMSVLAYRRWHRNQVAMRHARPLPGSPLTLLLVVTVSLVALAVAGALVWPVALGSG